MDVTGYFVLSSLSTQTLWLPVSSTNPTTGPVDLSSAGVQVGATQTGDPTVWHNASWQSNTPSIVDGNSVYLVRVDVGPSATLQLTKGFWNLFLKLMITSPEIIIQSSSLYLF
jgi:hypothetical protein